MHRQVGCGEHGHRLMNMNEKIDQRFRPYPALPEPGESRFILMSPFRVPRPLNFTAGFSQKTPEPVVEV